MKNDLIIFFGEIHLLCLGILLLLTVHTDHSGKMLTARLYSRILISIAGAGLLYALLLLLVHMSSVSDFILSLLHAGFVLLSVLSVFWWVYYLESKRHSPVVYNRMACFAGAIPVIVLGILLIVNLKFHFLFVFDNASLVSNTGADLVKAVAVFYSLGESIRYLCWLHQKKDVGYQDAFAIPAQLLFLFVPLAAVCLQTLLYQMPVFVPIMTLALLQEYLNETENRVSADPLTGLNNRLVLMNRMHSVLQHREPSDMALVMIDIDYFKSINDTYGHAMGDAALCQCADGLRNVCHGDYRHALISRYGGDEFVLLLPLEKAGDLTRLKELVQKEMDHQCLLHHTPYALHVSIGAARLSDEIRSEKQWLEAADEQMYAEKSAHHQSESRK